MCLAKPWAGGLPLGITVASENVMSSLKVGDHSTTFGGNPLVCAAGCVAIDVLIEEKLVDRAADLGAYFKVKLENLREHKTVKEVRGLGLMIGLEMKFDVLSIILKTMQRGALILDAGRNVVRFLPPLVIERVHIDKITSILDRILEDEENARSSGPAAN
jgi:acetylornithine/LysW-gamma-L-lysine aminotransferase